MWQNLVSAFDELRALHTERLKISNVLSGSGGVTDSHSLPSFSGGRGVGNDNSSSSSHNPGHTSDSANLGSGSSSTSGNSLTNSNGSTNSSGKILHTGFVDSTTGLAIPGDSPYASGGGLFSEPGSQTAPSWLQGGSGRTTGSNNSARLHNRKVRTPYSLNKSPLGGDGSIVKCGSRSEKRCNLYRFHCWISEQNMLAC
jgi:hypothetical protein